MSPRSKTMHHMKEQYRPPLSPCQVWRGSSFPFFSILPSHFFLSFPSLFFPLFFPLPFHSLLFSLFSLPYRVFTLKVRYDLHCAESAVKLQSTNQPTIFFSHPYPSPFYPSPFPPIFPSVGGEYMHAAGNAATRVAA